MEVEFLGHAGFLVKAGGATVACDPWLSPRGAYHASWFQFPSNHHLWDRSYRDLAAVVISHEHFDHLDPDFLAQRIAPATRIIIPRYPSRNLREKVARVCDNPIVEVEAGVEHPIEGTGLRVLFTSEESPANQDSAITFRAGGETLVNMNDARLTPKQRGELKQRLGRVDVLLLQSAGASWYPICYRYPPSKQREVSRGKRLAKFEYAFQTIEQFAPAITVPYAGPAAFLDDGLVRFNDDLDGDGIFPDQAQSSAWLRQRGYTGRMELALPGDKIDVTTGAWAADEGIRKEFSFEDKKGYVARYAERLRGVIAKELSGLPEPTADLFPDFCRHFERLGGLNAYFRGRIDMDIRFVIAGAAGGDFLVRCRPDGVNVERSEGRLGRYTLYFDQKWLHQILHHDLAWEDFFLSLRFEADRAPDVYNDHLLSWLKFADAEALAAIEAYERANDARAHETIVVQAPGGKYRISRYCPHAGAAMEKAVIDGGTIVCLNHHYKFDLETGRCLNGNCTLWTRKIDG